MKWILAPLSFLGLMMCGTSNTMVVANPNKNDTKKDTFVFDTNYIARKFRNPVGNPPGKNYYDAQPFMRNTHLGEDWNGTGGGNSDLGDTVYAAANGYIKFAENIGGGWGNVVRILHQLPKGNKYREVETLYAHFDQVLINPNTYVKIGNPIGTIGTAGGIYPAHLHFEMRHDVNLDIGGGYSNDTTGYMEPKKFIKEFNANN